MSTRPLQEQGEMRLKSIKFEGSSVVVEFEGRGPNQNGPYTTFEVRLVAAPLGRKVDRIVAEARTALRQRLRDLADLLEDEQWKDGEKSWS